MRHIFWYIGWIHETRQVASNYRKTRWFFLYLLLVNQPCLFSCVYNSCNVKNISAGLTWATREPEERRNRARILLGINFPFSVLCPKGDACNIRLEKRKLRTRQKLYPGSFCSLPDRDKLPSCPRSQCLIKLPAVHRQKAEGAKGFLMHRMTFDSSIVSRGTGEREQLAVTQKGSHTLGTMQCRLLCRTPLSVYAGPGELNVAVGTEGN